MLHKLRRAMIRPEREQLSGTVEVDETWVGGQRPRKWGHTGKAIVVVGVEVRGKWMGRIRLQRISNPSRVNLHGFVCKNVAPGSTVLTDGSYGYDGLQRLGYQYRFTVLKHEPKEAAVRVLPRVHRVASLLKRWLLGIYQGRASQNKIDRYLDEFAFRFNRRNSPHRGMLFRRLLENAVVLPATRYRDIIRNP
jgi:transposase-like protein